MTLIQALTVTMSNLTLTIKSFVQGYILNGEHFSESFVALLGVFSFAFGVAFSVWLISSIFERRTF